MLTRSLSAGLLLVAALVASAPALAQQGQPSAPSQTPPESQVHGSSDPLRPGDVIRLRIWREPDLSGEFPVRETGDVVLPKVGPMTVAGESPTAVRDRLVRAYSEFLQHTSIDVTLLRRVQVMGAVRNPGLYNVDPTMTVSDALALAGGATNEGDRRSVRLVRDGEPVDVKLNESTRLAAQTLRSGDQLVVPERSWISRNTGVVAAAITGGVSLLIALVR